MLRRFLLPLVLASASHGLAARGEISEEDRKWWAYQALTDPSPPAVQDKTWARNEIDLFVLARLESAGLKPAPEAGRRELARRLAFDLTGLPLSPAEVDAFEKDASPDACEKLVDRLLASSGYGERWARHWLDLVRYADSDGYKADDFRPNAWRYRDYVIRSFNADKGYDHFVREQIAGDELAPGDPDAVAATGFLRCWIYEYNNRDVVTQWSAILNDITDTTSDVFLGLGMQCARCHDHKFDPLLQKDYYRLQAFFAPILPKDDAVAAPADLRAAHAAKLADWETQTADLRRQIEAIESKYRDAAEKDAATKFPEETQTILAKKWDERTPLERQWGNLAFQQVIYEFDRIDGKIKGSDKEKIVALRKQLAAFDKLKPEALPLAPSVCDVGREAPCVKIPKREELGDILPGLPTILTPEPMSVTPLEKSTGRRLALANWLARPDNPLSTRVMVNRVWAWHFGRGLARYTSDFGRLGEPPSHPELLDWLTQRFVKEGWSLKKLHRRIVTSAAYRQSAHSPVFEEARQKDPENSLLWRWNTQRLEAEQIRDAVLAASGELDRSAGGPAVDFSKPRRSIYHKVLRNVRDPLLDVFDAPQHFNSTASRDTTTTAVQSLLLINSRYLLERAQEFSARLKREFPDNVEEQVSGGFQLTYGRHPSSDEREAAVGFIRSQQRQVETETPAETPFLAEAMPQREGKAAVLAPSSGQERLFINVGLPLAEGDFTVEAVALLRSVYENGEVRVVVSAWDGDNSHPGWALGITGKKSQRKPNMLVLQLVGHSTEGRVIYEPVFSDVQIQLERSYYLAASVHLGGAGEGKVTFYVKDLANDDQPLVTTVVPHPVARGVQPDGVRMAIGGRAAGSTGHQWDGLVDEIRLSRGLVAEAQCCYKTYGVSAAVSACWQFEAKTGFLRDTVSGLENLEPSTSLRKVAPVGDALTDFCHGLLNSNEFLYVE